MANEHKMIEPFADSQVRHGVISYGVSSYGYDMRLANEFRIFSPDVSVVKDVIPESLSRESTLILDPKQFDDKSFTDIKTDDFVIIPPNSFVLARTVEYFRIPRNILTICFGKSTYARCGVIVNVTPFEPEWEGFVTLAISNTAPKPAKLYANEGIAQVLFLESDEICAISYADKKGKYQAQKGITTAKI